MSPFPSKVTPELIVHRARAMIESEGVEALSLNKLAADLGIAAPSLYNHFKNKGALLRAVNAGTAEEMARVMLNGAEGETDLKTRFLLLAHAHRAFAAANPATYALAFNNMAEDQRPDADEMEKLALPLQALMAEYVGEERSLVATRGIWALLHGFAMLQITDQFRRQGNVDEAFEQSIKAFIEGWKP
jgi:AcrR family transcriptional regulator